MYNKWKKKLKENKLDANLCNLYIYIYFDLSRWEGEERQTIMDENDVKVIE